MGISLGSINVLLPEVYPNARTVLVYHLDLWDNITPTLHIIMRPLLRYLNWLTKHVDTRVRFQKGTTNIENTLAQLKPCRPSRF